MHPSPPFLVHPQEFAGSALSSFHTCIMPSRGVRNVMLYLDDYLIGGTLNSSECAEAFTVTLCTCEDFS